jgi:hypothetical protein
MASDENIHRYDPWEAIAQHHVFRDPWERKLESYKPETRDVRNTGDYPELASLFTDLDKASQPSGRHQASTVTNLENVLERFNARTGLRGPRQAQRAHVASTGLTAADHSDFDTDHETNSLHAYSPPQSPVSIVSGDEGEADSKPYVQSLVNGPRSSRSDSIASENNSSLRVAEDQNISRTSSPPDAMASPSNGSSVCGATREGSESEEKGRDPITRDDEVRGNEGLDLDYCGSLFATQARHCNGKCHSYCSRR